MHGRIVVDLSHIFFCLNFFLYLKDPALNVVTNVVLMSYLAACLSVSQLQANLKYPDSAVSKSIVSLVSMHINFQLLSTSEFQKSRVRGSEWKDGFSNSACS